LHSDSDHAVLMQLLAGSNPNAEFWEAVSVMADLSHFGNLPWTFEIGKLADQRTWLTRHVLRISDSHRLRPGVRRGGQPCSLVPLALLVLYAEEALPTNAPAHCRWRRRWDSNPRWSCPHGGFQDRCLKPLGHSSLKGRR